MNPKAKRVIGYLTFMIGIGLFTGTTTALHRGAEAAEQYREAISPYVTEQPVIRSGTSEETTKFDIQIPMNAQMDIRMLQLRMENQFDPELARWLLYLGVFMLILADSIDGTSKDTDEERSAESGHARQPATTSLVESELVPPVPPHLSFAKKSQKPNYNLMSYSVHIIRQTSEGRSFNRAGERTSNDRFQNIET